MRIFFFSRARKQPLENFVCTCATLENFACARVRGPLKISHVRFGTMIETLNFVSIQKKVRSMKLRVSILRKIALP